MVTAYCVTVNAPNVAEGQWQRFSYSSAEISDVPHFIGQFLTDASPWQVWAATTDARKASAFYLTLCTDLDKHNVLIEEIKIQSKTE